MKLASDIDARLVALPDLASVRLLRTHRNEDGVFPAGSEGTIVIVYNGGEAYEVEFLKPQQGLVTVYARDLEEVPDRIG